MLAHDLGMPMSADELDPAAVEPDEPERKRDDRRTVQAVAVLILTLFVACLCWWFYSQLVRVPDVRGMTIEAARAALARVGLEVGELTERKGLASEAGGIADQMPDAGSRVMRGTKVDLAVAVAGGGGSSGIPGGPLTPDEEDGEGLFPETPSPSDVTTTDPSPSSGGPTGPRVPLVMNMSVSAARAKLQAEGYRLGDVKYGPSTNDIAAGLLYYQDPAPETYHPYGTSVDVWVSTGDPDGAPYPQPD